MCSALINMMRMNKCGHRRNADITLPPPHPLSQRNIENTWEPSARSNKETPPEVKREVEPQVRTRRLKGEGEAQ